jgi:hypothetical protein
MEVTTMTNITDNHPHSNAPNGASSPDPPSQKDQTDPPGEDLPFHARKPMAFLAGLFMMISVVVLIALVPSINKLDTDGPKEYVSIDLIAWEIDKADVEVLMILFTLAGGLFGAAVRTGLEATRPESEQTSFTAQLIHSMLGVMAAFLMYAVIRGGVMGNGTTATDLQPWTLLVLATIASVTGAAYLRRITGAGLSGAD